MSINGYDSSVRTVNMVLENDLPSVEPEPPDPGVEITVAGEAKRSALPEVMINARTSAGDNLGMCLAYPLEYVQASESARDQLYINWLAVGREFQQKGWGRYLLLRTLWESAKLGYNHCVLGTDSGNYKAQLFYANYGYRVTHSSFAYFKDLSD